MIVVTEYGAARQQRDIVERIEQFDRLPGPVRGGHAVDTAARGQEEAAELVLFVGEDHAGAGLPGRERGGKSRRPAARDQDVAVRIDVFVAVGIVLRRRAAEARRSTHDTLVQVP